MRLGTLGDFIKWILPGQIAFFIRVRSENIGGGIFVQHGHSTRIGAKSIGDNLFINQNVTIGWDDFGCPEIGNNVRIGTGAIVFGNIKIGNNVKIGANATVVKSVPDNCTVVSPQAYICKRNGVKVNKPL